MKVNRNQLYITLLVVNVLVLLTSNGCQNEYQARLDALNARIQQLDNQLSLIKYRSQAVSERQAALMKTLNDQQLAVFKSAVQAYKSDDPVTQEAANRNLHQALDPNFYMLAIGILNDRVQLRHDNNAWEIDWMQLRDDSENFNKGNERREDATRDYMMLHDAIRNM